jgi:hypothetical protein
LCSKAGQKAVEGNYLLEPEIFLSLAELPSISLGWVVHVVGSLPKAKVTQPSKNPKSETRSQKVGNQISSLISK